MAAKIGAYICSGCGIGEAVDIAALEKLCLGALKFDLCRTDPLVCGGECLENIQSDIDDKGLNRIIVVGCSQRAFADRFDFGASVLVDRLPLRELVAWTQTAGDEETAALAEDYLRMSAAKMRNAEPPEPFKAEVCEDVLIIGAGPAGLSAALAAAAAGHKVHLVEAADELGGMPKGFFKVFPQSPPYETVSEPPTRELVAKVASEPRIEVHLKSKVIKTEGQPGQFDVTWQNGAAPETVRVGAVVQATGARLYNAAKLSHLGYGKFGNVVTSLDIERMALSGDFARPSDGLKPKRVAIIHCAGSRDKEHLPYCSAVCCRTALKQAQYIRSALPESELFLLYRDLRSPGVHELFFAAVQKDPRIYLVKGEVREVVATDGDSVAVTLDETLLGEPVKVEADLLVLAVGLVPSTLIDEDAPVGVGPVGEEASETKDAKKAGASAEIGAGILNLTYRLGSDLPTLKYGFPDSHFICFPYETRRTGIYAAGTVRAPMDIASAMRDGRGAALKAVQAIYAARHGAAVHPRSGDTSFPEFFLQRCTQCKRCTEECPFGTLDEDAKGTPLPNILRCRRCGICMGECPERIISFKNYSPNMVSQMVKAIEVPDEEEEKYRFIAFVCENDALPALDIAARHRARLDPAVRFIPVRCIGSVNTVWIADALSAGFDGILLLGCNRGEDYQCHFIRGSELANRRMENVQEKLKQLALESERVRIAEVELSDWNSLPELVNGFTEVVRNLGMNPYKGF